jgi:hypothetical protein
MSDNSRLIAVFYDTHAGVSILRVHTEYVCKLTPVQKHIRSIINSGSLLVVFMQIYLTTNTKAHVRCSGKTYL